MIPRFKEYVGAMRVLYAVAVVVSASGCATVKNIDPKTDKDVGFTHYEAKVYLVRRVNKDGSTSLEAITLPDLNKQRSIRHRPGWGSLDFNFTLANGVLTGFGQKADTAVPGGITALGALGTGYGDYLGGLAALATAEASATGNDAAIATVPNAGNQTGPAGFTTGELTRISKALEERADKLPDSPSDSVQGAAKKTMECDAKELPDFSSGNLLGAAKKIMKCAAKELVKLNSVTEVETNSSFLATVHKWKSRLDKSVTKPINRTIHELDSCADDSDCAAGSEARTLASYLKNDVIAPIDALLKPAQTIRIWELKGEHGGIKFEPIEIDL